MDGVHDLGGMHGFGPVCPEPDEPVFHTEWERRVFSLRLICRSRRLFNIDEGRSAIEAMDPAEYLGSGYYEHWLVSLEKVLIDKGVLSAADLDTRTRLYEQHPDTAVPRRDDPAFTQQLREGLRRGGPAQRPTQAAPRFAVGDAVRTRRLRPRGHTRLPRYARGKVGRIERCHGTFVFPDTNAHGLGEQPQPLYNVRFDAAELWGESAEPRGNLHLDVWESYLEPA